MKNILFLATLLLLFCGCIQPAENEKYFETVIQDPSCSNNSCFHEIFAMQDGLVMIKQKTTGLDYVVSFCTANEAKLAELFSLLEKNLGSNKLEECGNCATMHLFYGNNAKTVYHSIPLESAVFEKEFFEKAKQLCSKNASAEFVHVIFGKNDKYSDYHIFSNNRIVFEKFGLKEGELLESRITTITVKEFEEIKSSFGKDFFSAPKENGCDSEKYFYGFVEAFSAGNYSYDFTCGGNTLSGKAFAALSKRFSE